MNKPANETMKCFCLKGETVMIKKLIAIVLMISLFSFTITPLSAAVNKDNTVRVGSVIYYWDYSSTKNLFISVDTATNEAIASYYYLNNPEIIYEYRFDNIGQLRENISGNWNELITEAINNQSKANVLMRSEFIEEQDVNDVAPSSASTSLVNKMKGLYGQEYSGDELASDTTYPGVEIVLYQGLTIRANKQLNASFAAGLAVTSFLVATLGHLPLPKDVQSFLTFLGTYISFQTFIVSGAIWVYQCYADYYRYTQINGGSRIYTMTSETHYHNGFEHPGNPSDSLLMDRYAIEYTDSQSYYYSYIQQFEDAYRLYS